MLSEKAIRLRKEKSHKTRVIVTRTRYRVLMKVSLNREHDSAAAAA